MSSPGSPTPDLSAGETGEDDIEDVDDALGNSGEDGTDAVDDGGEAGADRGEDLFDLGRGERGSVS
jgi:hypothetical protein